MKDKELAELRNATSAQIKEITKRFETQINDKTKYIEEINADVAQKALILIKLEKDIADLRAIITSKDEEIKHLLEKTSGKIEWKAEGRSKIKYIYVNVIWLILILLELQDTLTLSEQTKTNLESELRVFESNVQKLNQQIARAEEKVSQLSLQKEKLVGIK